MVPSAYVTVSRERPHVFGLMSKPTQLAFNESEFRVQVSAPTGLTDIDRTVDPKLRKSFPV